MEPKSAETTPDMHLRDLIQLMKRGGMVSVTNIPNDPTFVSSHFDGKTAQAMADRVEISISTDAVLMGEPLELPYKNWRGEISTRKIQPIRLEFGATEWHPEPQWLLVATDIEKNAERSFALKDFNPQQPAPTLAVKALDWYELTSPREDGPAEPTGDWEASCGFGEYSVCFEQDEEMAETPWCAWSPDRNIGNFSSLEKAKAAAQTDYEDRIKLTVCSGDHLSQLENDPKTLRWWCQQLLDIIDNYAFIEDACDEDSDLVNDIRVAVDPAFAPKSSPAKWLQMDEFGHEWDVWVGNFLLAMIRQNQGFVTTLYNGKRNEFSRIGDCIAWVALNVHNYRIDAQIRSDIYSPGLRT